MPTRSVSSSRSALRSRASARRPREPRRGRARWSPRTRPAYGSPPSGPPAPPRSSITCWNANGESRSCRPRSSKPGPTRSARPPRERLVGDRDRSGLVDEKRDEIQATAAPRRCRREGFDIGACPGWRERTGRVVLWSAALRERRAPGHRPRVIGTPQATVVVLGHRAGKTRKGAMPTWPDDWPTAMIW